MRYLLIIVIPIFNSCYIPNLLTKQESIRIHILDEFLSIKRYYKGYTRELHNIIQKELVGKEVPLSLVLATIQAESRWKIRAQGKPVYYKALDKRVRAIGLMQIMPIINYRGDPKDLYRPEINLRYGIAYLNWCYKKANRNLVDTIKNYNSGPNSTFYNWPHIKKILKDEKDLRYVSRLFMQKMQDTI